MLIPQRLAEFWRGITDPATGEFRDLDMENPVTDYDRACAVGLMWPSRRSLEFRGAEVLVLYTECDQHTWDSKRQMVACGGWLPREEELARAKWSERIEPIRWEAKDTDYFLMNPAADASAGLEDDDFMPVRLRRGVYTIEFTYLSARYEGIFYRFVREDR